ncbi:AAA family ATPase [Mycoplasma sp. CSL7475-4]|uniref:ATP-dependent DNA helicase n=1 Tax=Mycoplasma sp. CSL7475-4 TaxID=2973942 RepID=UPI00216B12A4|nr:AAA family ATPase [Mycoplasma sp. CSL7475-4]MCS4536613.1 AAA family ATPase [Mycoplasma sp. CSL7475-4]
MNYDNRFNKSKNTENIKTEEVIGSFKKVLSGGESVDWSYTLASFQSDEGKHITIYIKKEKIKLMTPYKVTLTNNHSAAYKNNKILVFLEIAKPRTSLEIKKVISRSVPGVGPRTIQKLDEKFGEDWPEKFQNEPEYFQSKITSSTFESLSKYFDELKDKSYAFFVKNGLQKLYDVLKKDFPDLNLLDYFAQNNPYNLVIDDNYVFDEIDKLCHLLELDTSQERLKALVFSSIEKIMYNGSTLVSINDIEKQVAKSAIYNQADLYEAIQSLINDNKLIFDERLKLITTYKMREKEKFIAATLIALRNKSTNTKNNLTLNTLSPLQQEAFDKAVSNKISIISGFPGTGKSYVIKAIIDFFKENKIYRKKSDIAVVAPTGRASINIKNKLNVEAKTIHSFFKIGDNSLKTNLSSSSTELEHKLLIIDEFSMVNTDILYLVLKNSPNLERLILVGDADQLPCIGPGNILADLVDSNVFPLTKLIEIFRTDSKEIPDHFLNVKNNHGIELNEKNTYSYSEKSKPIEISEANEYDFQKQLVEIYQQKVNEFGIDNVAVLLPMNNTPNGIVKINKLLQKWNKANNFNNDNEVEYRSFGSAENPKIFYLKDKVVQGENDYELDVYNGEIGYIKSFDGKKITVDFLYKEIVYEKEQFNKYISLGYAVTVHKFQGSESKSVIFGVLNEFERMLDTKLIYTAVSRAQSNLVLLGDMQKYNYRIQQHKNNNIHTSLTEFLKKEGV